jgi:hypothetical protein
VAGEELKKGGDGREGGGGEEGSEGRGRRGDLSGCERERKKNEGKR